MNQFQIKTKLKIFKSSLILSFFLILNITLSKADELTLDWIFSDEKTIAKTIFILICWKHSKISSSSYVKRNVKNKYNET